MRTVMLVQELLQPTPVVENETTEWDAYPILKLLHREMGVNFLKLMVAWEAAKSWSKFEDDEDAYDLKEEALDIIVNSWASRMRSADLGELHERAQKQLQRDMKAYKRG